MDKRYGRVKWGAGEDRKRTAPGNWQLPFRWDRAAAGIGEIHPVFCLSLGDIWDNEVDPRWRAEAFAVMRQTPNLLYLLLSKRIGNAEKMCAELPPNVALGATMASQDEWDRDQPKLERAGQVLGAKFTFASIEPMLGPIETRGQLPDWIIVGGESGSNTRFMEPAWARSLRDQCAEAEKPFFMKQMTDKRPIPEDLLIRQFPSALQ